MIPPSSFLVTIIMAAFLVVAIMICFWQAYKRLSKAIRIALFIAVVICFCNWYFIAALWIKVLITIWCIAIVWIAREIEIAPTIKEDNTSPGEDIFC